jgi:hypothetical protein
MSCKLFRSLVRIGVVLYSGALTIFMSEETSYTLRRERASYRHHRCHRSCWSSGYNLPGLKTLDW